MAQGAMRAATATPEPEDEPPGVRWMLTSQGFLGGAEMLVGTPAAVGKLDVA